MVLSATEFRQHLYSTLASVVQSGEEVIISHKGYRFHLIPEDRPGFLERLVSQDVLAVPAEDIIESGTSGWSWSADTGA